MTSTKPIQKKPRVFIIIGSILLILMAAFHSSGAIYVTQSISESNSETFLKDIVPALFVHPSFHLLGVSAFGFLSLSLGVMARKVLFMNVILVVLDAALGFYLGGPIPGVLLLLAASCYMIAGLSINKQ